ncbi:MAG: hypothetical protein KC456_03175 [Flavobacteriales bacterium]|nr:hypothetical protein [Flavobacteriales bacterium]
MKSIGISFMICIFHFAGYSGSENNTFQLADSLKDEGAFEWAALEYERICFEAFDNVVKTEALNKKSDCLLGMNNPKAAQKNLLRINYFGISDSLVYESRFRTAYSSYLSEDFEQAASQLFLVDQFLPERFQQKAAILYAITLNELRKWDQAKAKLEFWVEHSDLDSIGRDSALMNIDAVYNADNYPKFRDPERASTWSTFIPGSGQLYSGHFWDAAFSVAMMVTGLGLAAVGIFVIQYYVAGVILGYGVFQRFYMAGVKRAEYLANRKNYRTKRDYNTELLAMITLLQKKSPIHD